MNILPKKRWHVRNRENIARVRKDELAAENEEKEKERRRLIAEQEAKLQILRCESKRKNLSSTASDSREETKKCTRYEHEHVNLFEALEASTTNEEREREIKEEKEKYEKQIGYLTYLGQNTNEADGRTSWYNKPRNELNCFVKEAHKKDEKSKSLLDPLTRIETILRKKSASSKYNNMLNRNREEAKTCSKAKTKRDKGAQLAALREKRLKREKEEKAKIEKLLSSIRGAKSVPIDVSSDADADAEEADKSAKKFSRRYNSQFNPHLARQNYIE